MNSQRRSIQKQRSFGGAISRLSSHRSTDSAPADIRNDKDIRKKDVDQTIVRLHRSDPRIQTLPHWSEKFYFSVKHAKRELEAGRRLPPGGVVCKSSRLTKMEGKSVYFLIRSKETDHRRPASVDSPDLRIRNGSDSSDSNRYRRSNHVSVVRLHRDDPRIQLLPHWSDKFNNSVKLATRVVDAGLRLPVDGVICKSDRLTAVEGKDVFFCLSPAKHNRIPRSTRSDGQLLELNARYPSEPPASPALRPDRMDHDNFIPSTPAPDKMSANGSSEADSLDFPVEVTRATFIEC